MDPLTEIFTEMNINWATFTRLEATAPWAWASAGDAAVTFVLVVRGSGVLAVDGYPEPFPLCGGDVFIMLDDKPYQMYDRKGSLPIPCAEIEKLRIGDRIEVGGGGAPTTFISGYFDMNAIELHPLSSMLPGLLHLKLDHTRSLAFHSVLELLATETETPSLGADAVVRRLFELLFIHAIRAYCAQTDGAVKGWMAAIGDQQLMDAIHAIHADPAQKWTVASLAKEAGMSRSAFAARFRTVVGVTPLEYVTRWRLHRASRQIRTSDAPLAKVAYDAGYESVAAFNRLFKRETGLTPGAFRKSTIKNSGRT